MNTNGKTTKKDQWLLLLFYCALALAPLHIPLGSFHISVMSVFLVGVLFYERKTLHQAWKTYAKNNPLTVSALVGLVFFLGWGAVVAQSRHALGIWLLWVVLPINAGLLFCALWKRATRSARVVSGLWGGAVFLGVVLLGAVVYGTTYDGRLQSFWPAPTYLAMVITPLMPIMLLGALVAPQRTARRLYALGGGALFGVLLWTQSLFALGSLLLSAVVVFGVALFLRHVHLRISGRVFSIVGIIILLSVGAVVALRADSLLKEPVRSSVASRVIIWDVAHTIIQRNPLQIHGLGTFEQAYLREQTLYPPFLEWAVPTPHNLWLMMWFSGGLGALFCFLVLFSGALLRAFFATKNTHSIFALALGSALLIIGIHGMVDTPVFGNDLGTIFWTLFFASTMLLEGKCVE